MSQRREFVEMALKEEVPLAELCRRYGISRPTGYKWLGRYRAEGEEGLLDRSSRPARSPLKTPPEVERAVLELRDEHPAWGARKLRRVLQRRGTVGELPAPSTCQAILERGGKIDPAHSGRHTAFKRFEHAAPNDLWQMDHKGHVPCGERRCFPLTVLDDHSRFNVLLRAHGDERTNTVKTALISAFRRYGLPTFLIMDNGNPWGDQRGAAFTAFDVWLMRLGVTPLHSRPAHPQTMGKDERFHRTLKAELLQHLNATTLEDFQHHFDRWRDTYNTERPHEALGLNPPSSAYRPSPRPYPEQLKEIEYAPDLTVYTVKSTGCFQYHGGHQLFLGRALAGEKIALQPTTQDGILNLLFSHLTVATLNLKTMKIQRKDLPCLSPNL